MLCPPYEEKVYTVIFHYSKILILAFLDILEYTHKHYKSNSNLVMSEEYRYKDNTLMRAIFLENVTLFLW
jgi:hypothetical protein